MQGPNRAKNPGERMAMDGLQKAGAMSKCTHCFSEAEQSMWRARAWSCCLSALVKGSESRHPKSWALKSILELSIQRPAGGLWERQATGIQDTDISG